jgi:2-haloacid dehalogenase
VPVTTCVILDVNETLSDLTPLADRLEDVGAPRHLLATWFAGTLRDGIGLAAAGGYAEFRDVGADVLRAMLSAVGDLRGALDEAVDHVLQGFATLSVHPDVPGALRRLHDAGIRLATLTNGAAENALHLLQRAHLDDLVERFLSVSEVGRWKPAPEPYRYACAELGVPAADAVLIAAHPWDIDGAKRAGLRAAWLDRANRPFPRTMIPPDFTASDFETLASELAT